MKLWFYDNPNCSTKFTNVYINASTQRTTKQCALIVTLVTRELFCTRSTPGSLDNKSPSLFLCHHAQSIHGFK